MFFMGCKPFAVFAMLDRLRPLSRTVFIDRLRKTAPRKVDLYDVFSAQLYLLKTP
jgi:hypothetical protein